MRKLFIAFAILSALPFSAKAEICCKCSPPTDSKKTICIKTPLTDCAGLALSKNTDVKSLNCVEKIEASCKPPAEGGVCTDGIADELLYNSSTSTKKTGGAINQEYKPPELGVAIPGLQFSSNLQEIEGQIHVPWFAQYISALQQYLIAISIVAAAIMIVYGGFLYIVGSSGVRIQSGKDIIFDAIIGLLLVLGSITILQIINPATIQPHSLALDVVKSQFAHIEVIDIDYTPSAPSTSAPGEPTPAPPPFQPSDGPPPAQAGAFALPPTPGSRGWIRNGNCDFELNQAGKPTILSTYKCAIETVAKEEGVHACYLVTALAKETYLGMTDIIGHDENPTHKTTVGGVLDFFPERRKFLNSGKSYKALLGLGGFTFTPLSANPNLEEKRVNDDYVDLSKPDLGLDKRFSHGFGIGLTKIPFGCAIDTDKRKWIQPYYALQGGAKWTKCTLQQLNAVDYQTSPGTVFNHYQRWGGCYGPGGVAAPCVDFPKDYTGFVGKASGYSGVTITCLKSEDPYKTIFKGHFTICRGDLPLDREACKEYVKEHLQDLGVLPNSACSATCYDKRMPVLCKPGTSCAQLEVNPKYKQ